LIDDPDSEAGARNPPVGRGRSGETDAEADLIRHAQAGDRNAFDVLYERHANRIYALCLRMARDGVAAERFTQDAFVRAWQRLRTFRGDSAFTSWLHRLAVNVVLEDARREKRRADRVTFGYQPDDLHAARTSAPEARLDLERAIAALPQGARSVLVLHDIEGYKHNEIGEMLGIAVGTSKAQLHRARRLLREWMEQ
jgi:RNA polymerase sigma-70 factor (ECF subfamily)